MRRMPLVIVAGALFLAVAAGTALAATIRCPTAGQGVRDGTNNPDIMNGMGGIDGRDLMSGFGGGDRVTAGRNDVVSANGRYTA